MKINLKLLVTLFLISIHFCSSAQQQFDIEPIQLGRISSALYETSGIAVTANNKIWSHNDSGNSNEIFCIDTNGVVLRSITIINAENVDWEDMTLDAAGNLYINDAGNNNNDRHNLKILKIPDPDLIDGNAIEAEIISFVLEDQTAFPPTQNNRNFDIEAIAYKFGYLYLFTKNRSTPQNGWCKMYRLPAIAGQFTASLQDSIFLGANNDDARVTAADIHPQTGELVLLTANRIISFTEAMGDRFLDGVKNYYTFTSEMGQIEAIQFFEGRKIYITEEGSSSNPGYIYRVDLGTINGLDDHSFKNYFQIFPNPASGSFKLKTTLPGLHKALIYSIDGRLIDELNFNAHTTVSIFALKPGIYLIQINLSGKAFQEKLFVY
jgi:hypothetical protein